jgi:hypothetical protein
MGASFFISQLYVHIQAIIIFSLILVARTNLHVQDREQDCVDGSQTSAAVLVRSAILRPFSRPTPPSIPSRKTAARHRSRPSACLRLRSFRRVPTLCKKWTGSKDQAQGAAECSATSATLFAARRARTCGIRGREIVTAEGWARGREDEEGEAVGSTECLRSNGNSIWAEYSRG